jgi:hypothetical protein
VWLATQNPVDLDYKAMGNAGIKVIGRLITDRDRDRALEGLGLAGTEDGREIERVVGSLAKREFLLHDVRAKTRIQVFSSRWALSYLRGPIALSEMGPLLSHASPTEEMNSDHLPDPAPPGWESVHQIKDCRSGPPVLPIDIPQLFGAQSGQVTPWLLVHNRVTIERRTLALVRTKTEFWHVPIDEQGNTLWDEAEPLAFEPELSDEPHAQAHFPLAAPKALAKDLRSADRSFVRWRARRTIGVLANTELDCAADEGERLEQQLEDLADEMLDEIEEIAAASEEIANAVEEVAIRPKQADVTVKEISLVWET